MRLEVKYPDKPPHEVDLKVSLAVVGRDPSCDLVISDERCSRRHAVLEETPTGLQIRDAGSANGIYVNGKKAERSPLVRGDLVRLGEVILKVLAEDTPGTLVMGDDDLVDLGPPPEVRGRASSAAPPPDTAPLPGRAPAAPRPPARPPSGNAPLRPASVDHRAHQDPIPATLPRTVARRPAPATRPVTVTLLASLWLVSVVLYAAAALGAAPLFGLQGTAAGVTIGASAFLAFASGAMAYGLFTLQPWARLAQAAVAGLGLLVCPFTLASATTLVYVLRPGTRSAFGPPEGRAADSADMTFALILIATVVLGGGLCLVSLILTRLPR